jgi:hypothetical protein
MFFDTFVKMFSSKNMSPRNDLLTLAKIEYGNDWEWAYDKLLTSNGKMPRLGGKL